MLDLEGCLKKIRDCRREKRVRRGLERPRASERMPKKIRGVERKKKKKRRGKREPKDQGEADRKREWS